METLLEAGAVAILASALLVVPTAVFLAWLSSKKPPLWLARLKPKGATAHLEQAADKYSPSTATTASYQQTIVPLSNLGSSAGARAATTAHLHVVHV